MTRTTIVKLSHISKCYSFRHGKPTLAERIVAPNDNKYWALKNISLTVNKGDFVGVIGANGAGKTTLLKVISKIIKPTTGKITTKGTIISLIELAAGFQPDLSGIENIHLNGLLMGMSNNEIRANLNSIIEFSGIGDRVYQPIYTFSEGMLLRLGFSMIVAADPDILVFDENLFVGDKQFFANIHQTLIKWKQSSKTLILSSHNLHFIEKYCEQGILLDRGKVKLTGKIHQVIDQYTKDMPKETVAVLFNKHYDDLPKEPRAKQKS